MTRKVLSSLPNDLIPATSGSNQRPRTSDQISRISDQLGHESATTNQRPGTCDPFSRSTDQVAVVPNQRPGTRYEQQGLASDGMPIGCAVGGTRAVLGALTVIVKARCLIEVFHQRVRYSRMPLVICEVRFDWLAHKIWLRASLL